MKTLTIIRHAKPDRDNPNLSDFDYPLSKRGFSDAEAMGIFLKQRGIVWDLVISSSAKRALTTAEILLDKMGLVSEILLKEFAFYNTSAYDVCKVIEANDNSIDSLALVGHNPTQQSLVQHYTFGVVADFPTMAVAILSFNIDNWVNIGKHKAQDFELLTPKTIKK